MQSKLITLIFGGAIAAVGLAAVSSHTRGQTSRFSLECEEDFLVMLPPLNSTLDHSVPAAKKASSRHNTGDV